MRIAALLILVLLFPAAAVADGLPVGGLEVGPDGVTAPASPHRFVALPAGKNTLVARIERDGGQVRGFRTLKGRLTIPAVAYDGSAAGVSHDGTRLVLIVPRPAFPRAKTTFAFLDTATLRPLTRLTLNGDFSFDAMSPDARWLYLIQYTSPDDPLQYRVRALDSVTGKLDPKPIVDPREPGEPMNGHPLTRAMSPDGRWAYTLYEGTEHPFVHALDTTGRSARCIDLDWLHGRKDLWLLRFSVSGDGRQLEVRSSTDTVASVDTETWAASPRHAGPGGGDSRWPEAGLAALLAAAVVMLYAFHGRRRTNVAYGE